AEIALTFAAFCLRNAAWWAGQSNLPVCAVWVPGARRVNERSGAGAARPSVVRRHQPVADGRVALQEPPASVGQLLPQPVGVHLEIVQLLLVTGPPHAFQNHPAGADLADVAGQVGEEVELLRREIERLAAE